MAEIISEQFEQNIGVLSQEDLKTIQTKKVIVIGLGGIGGNLVHHLVRLGVRRFVLVDYDRFDMSNLNRQLYSHQYNIGKYKAMVVKNELLQILPGVEITVCMKKIQELEMPLFADVDYIMDAVDNIETKVFIEDLGTQANKPVLHGACGGWFAQVGWLQPGSTVLRDMYGEAKKGVEAELRNPSFTPAVTAAFMAAEFVKYIQKADSTTINKIRFIDLQNNVLHTMED